MQPQKLIKHIYDQENSIQLFQTGRIFKLILGGKIIIEGRQPYQSLNSGGYLMYPWVNRLQQQHPIMVAQNLDGNGLPLHGMVVNKERKINYDIEQKYAICASLFLIINSLKKYKIIKQDKLRFKFKILSQNMDPICFGYHPFLQINGRSLNELKIKTNIKKNIKLNQKLLPVFPFQYKDIEINQNGSYDNLFIVEDKDGGYLQLIDQKNNIKLKIQSNLKYWQVYTPPDRTRIAVQPMNFCANIYKLYPQVNEQLAQSGGFSISLQK